MFRKKKTLIIDACIAPEVSKANATNLAIEKYIYFFIYSRGNWLWRTCYRSSFSFFFFSRRLKMAENRFTVISKGNPTWLVMSHFNTQKYLQLNNHLPSRFLFQPLVLHEDMGIVCISFHYLLYVLWTSPLTVAFAGETMVYMKA